MRTVKNLDAHFVTCKTQRDARCMKRCCEALLKISLKGRPELLPILSSVVLRIMKSHL